MSGDRGRLARRALDTAVGLYVAHVATLAIITLVALGICWVYLAQQEMGR